jgi:hypothetical protein
MSDPPPHDIEIPVWIVAKPGKTVKGIPSCRGPRGEKALAIFSSAVEATTYLEQAKSTKHVPIEVVHPRMLDDICEQLELRGFTHAIFYKPNEQSPAVTIAQLRFQLSMHDSNSRL